MLRNRKSELTPILVAFEKVKRVVESADSMAQLASAELYVNLFGEYLSRIKSPKNNYLTWDATLYFNNRHANIFLSVLYNHIAYKKSVLYNRQLNIR